MALMELNGQLKAYFKQRCPGIYLNVSKLNILRQKCYLQVTISYNVNNNYKPVSIFFSKSVLCQARDKVFDLAFSQLRKKEERE